MPPMALPPTPAPGRVWVENDRQRLPGLILFCFADLEPHKTSILLETSSFWRKDIFVEGATLLKVWPEMLPMAIRRKSWQILCSHSFLTFMSKKLSGYIFFWWSSQHPRITGQDGGLQPLPFRPSNSTGRKSINGWQDTKCHVARESRLESGSPWFMVRSTYSCSHSTGFVFE